MCNAWNHSDDCDCGFGSDTGGGVVQGAIQPVIAKRYSWEAGRRITHPTSCWWCRKPVYFFRDENGGCALFDSLGWPWPIHECWEQHRSDQTAFIQRIREEYRYRFSGAHYDVQPVDPQIVPGRQLDILVNGWIAGLKASPPRLLAVNERTMQFQSVIVVDGRNRAFTVHIPTGIVEDKLLGSPCTVTAKWVSYRSSWILIGELMRLPDREPVAGLAIPDDLVCRYCGQTLYRSRDRKSKWGVDSEGGFECAACGNDRRGLTPTEFMTIRSRAPYPDPQRYRQACRARLGNADLSTAASCGVFDDGDLRITINEDGTWSASWYGYPGGSWLEDDGAVRLFDNGSRLWFSLSPVGSSQAAVAPDVWVQVDLELAERMPTSELGMHRRFVKRR